MSGLDVSSRVRGQMPILPEPDRAVDGRPFLGGRVAFLGLDRSVVGGIAGERLEHREVVLHAVHLGPHEVVIDPLRDRPARRVDRREPLLEALQLREAPGVGGRRVVGYAARRAAAPRRRATRGTARATRRTSPALGRGWRDAGRRPAAGRGPRSRVSERDHLTGLDGLLLGLADLDGAQAVLRGHHRRAACPCGWRR